MNKPDWFLSEVKYISAIRKISEEKAEKQLFARINLLAEDYGSEEAAYHAYNLERIDREDEAAFVEEYVKQYGTSEDVARSAFRALVI